MSAEPLCGWFGNPLGGVTAIHINQRKLKLEKDHNENFHTGKIIQQHNRIQILQVSHKNLILGW